MRDLPRGILLRAFRSEVLLRKMQGKGKAGSKGAFAWAQNTQLQIILKTSRAYLMVNNPTGKGGFLPGQSGNPGGRPKLLTEVQHRTLSFCHEALDVVVSFMRGERDKTDYLRLQAAQSILDRGVGRAAQQ